VRDARRVRGVRCAPRTGSPGATRRVEGDTTTALGAVTADLGVTRGPRGAVVTGADETLRVPDTLTTHPVGRQMAPR
jgi:hypothetical protein